MYKKICPKCRMVSYCASRLTQWICYNCGEKLDDVKAEPAISKKEDNLEN